MLIQGQMGVRGVVHFLAFFFMLFTLVAPNPGRMKESEELLLANIVHSGEVKQDMAELLWLHCRIELMRANEAVEDLEYYVPEDESSGSNEILLNRRSTKHNVNVLHPLVKQALLGCLREKNLMFVISGEEKGTPKWYTRCVEFLFSWHLVPNRRELIQGIGGTAAPPPNPPPGRPPSQPVFQRKVDTTTTTKLQQDADKSKKKSEAKDRSKKKKESNNSSTVVAALVTAASTFLSVALLFICYCKVCGSGSKKGWNDERPLLSLSSSDYSVASSRMSFSGNGNSHNKLSGNFYMEPNTLSDSKIEIPLGTTGSVLTAAGDSVRVPSGRMSMAGLPPLKPPPGRVIPSEAPAKPAPTPPPPPAPPAPPPPPPPSSVGPRPSAPGPPPPPPPIASRARPPPPPGRGVPPPRPPPSGFRPPRPSPLGSNASTSASDVEGTDASKTKLKPFFWDKVLANPDNTMVWHQIKAGSFQFDEDMIESLFGYAAADKTKSGSKKDSASVEASKNFIQIIDQKKAQNLSILLKALNVTTEEVCDALKEGNELPSELLQTLLKMAPTAEEELKLRLYNGDLSRLGNAERFLKTLVDIPFAFKRLETLIFMCTLHDEASTVKESFSILEAACTELRKSRLFLKLLEAVLKTGNRMNNGTFRGGAQAFKLDTLLKLSDVKGIDGKTTLLHFVVQEIIRSEGIRAARAARYRRSSMSSIMSDDLLEDLPQDSEEYYRSTGLQVVSGLSSELENVKRAAALDADSLTGTVSKIGHALIKARDFLNSEMKNIDDEDGFQQTAVNFVQNAEGDVMWLLEEEKRIMALVKNTGDYFHGNAGKDEGLRLFLIVRDFLIILDKVCREVKTAPRKQNSTPRKENVAITTSESNRETVTTSEPTREPVTTSESTREPVTTSESTREPVTTSEPTREPVTTLEPTREPITTSEPTHDTVTTSESTLATTATSKSTHETVATSESTRATIATSKSTHETVATSESTHSRQPDPRLKLFPAITDRRIDDSSSDDDSF